MLGHLEVTAIVYTRLFIEERKLAANSFGRNAIDRRIREKEKKREARGQPEKREDNGKTEYWLRHVHRPRERHLRQEKSLIDV